jgi:hypothetical protein
MNTLNFRNARAVAFLSECQRLGRAALSSSAVAHWAHRTADEAAAIGRQSRLADATRWAGRLARNSWSYRWLTAEPDPDVVVIDLRDTMIIGPVLGLYDRLLGPLVRYWRGAWTGAVTTRLAMRFVARPIQVVSAVALVAILTNLLLLTGLGSPPQSAMGVRLVLASLALAGTRVSVSAEEMTETGTYRRAVKLLSPPDPPEHVEQNDTPPK